MAGILDFLTDVGGDRELSGAFVSVVASPDCTRQDLLDFFSAKNYADVTKSDADKILAERDNIRNNFNVPPNVDY